MKYKIGDVLWFINAFHEKVIIEITEVTEFSYIYRIDNFEKYSEEVKVNHSRLDNALLHYMLSHRLKKL